MKVIFGDNGITFKVLLRSQTIPYSEIYSVGIKDMITAYTTRGGDEIWVRFNGAPHELYQMIMKHNIIFRNEDELKDQTKTYTRDQADKMIDDLMSFMQETASEAVKNEFGLDHEVTLKVKDNLSDICLGYTVTCEGEFVCREEDAMTLAYLVEWDPSVSGGRYCVTREMEDRNLCRKCINRDIGYLKDDN